MCSRYGWTLHYIYALPFTTFFEVIEDLNDALQEEFKDQFLIQSFSAWQITEVLKAMVSGEKYKPISFSKYAEKLKLIEKKESKDEYGNISKVAIEHEKKKALENASNILEEFRKGRKLADDGSI